MLIFNWRIVSGTPDYFRKYGPKVGFMCYILRYWLLLNWEKNLHIQGPEFMIGAAVMLSLDKLDIVQYQKLQWVPTARCVTLFNWLQVH